MLNKIALAAVVTVAGIAGAQADINPSIMNQDELARSASQSPTMSFIGDRYRIGVGLDTEFDIIGEFLATLHETSTSAWLGEGWMGKKGAGGLKLNYHWLLRGQSVEGPDGPVYVDGHIAKLFIAADQNQHDDRKLTLGFGWEHEDFFVGAYGMRALTGKRLLNQAVDFQDFTVTGFIDGRGFTRIDTLQRITDTFEKPYDWGLGLRAGQYFDGRLTRLQGGMDYERGDFSNAQFTASASLDRFFEDTPHGISLRGGWAHKRGDLRQWRNDWRASLVYSYSFGRHYRAQREFREQAVEIMPEPRFEERLVATEVTLSDQATFDLDSAVLRPAAQATLQDLVAVIRDGGLIGSIEVVGHTCNLGPVDHNQRLSERRARSVVDFLLANGIDAQEIVSQGRGVHEPRFPNDSEQNRARNRRVEITFATEQSRSERIQVSPEGPITEIRMVEIPTEAPWIRRALRNPVRHKREVDTYRFQEVTRTLTEGEVVLDNQPPIANPSQFVVETNSSNNVLDVLANDVDPDGDPLSIASITMPGNGNAEIGSGVILYTPAPGFVGMDSFVYTVDDGFGGQDSATVTIEVVSPNQPPQANDVNASTLRTQPVDIDVLANDVDPDGDPLEILSFAQPANGSVTQVGNQLRYVPDLLFVGQDSFTYRIGDGRGGESSATVFVDVAFANRAPVAIADEASGPAGMPITVDVLANDFDPDGDPIEVISVVRISSAPADAVINADGSITFTISATCSGLNLFRYTITDPFGATAEANVTVRRQLPEGMEADPECIL